MGRTDLSLADLSKLDCRYWQSADHHNVLVVSFTGNYGIGSAGNGDGQFIAAMTVAGVVAFSPSAVLLDLQAMAYTWGNTLLLVFQEVDKMMNEEGEPAFPVHVAVSEKCEPAFLSPIGAPENAPAWVHRDVGAALDAAQKAGDEWLDA